MKIGVLGCNGKVGKQLVKTLYYNNPAYLGGCLEAPESPVLGKDIGDLLNIESLGIKVTNNVHEVFSSCNVLIDFTNNIAATEHVKIAAQYKKPIIVGTTGFNDIQDQTIKKLSKDIPIVKSSNMSLGVNILFRLVEYTSKVLSNENFDIEIIEKHHKYKQDAPSGTAITLGKLIAKTKNVNLSDMKYSSIKKNAKIVNNNIREPNKIAFHSIRGGNIIGEHSILFIGEGEVLELKHAAISRDIFIQGSIKAAKWIINKPNGLYSFKEILNQISEE